MRINDNDRPGAVNSASSDAAWAEWAEPLTAWALQLRNRDDIYVRYLPADRRWTDENGRRHKARTVHAEATPEIIHRHFVGADVGHLIALHAVSREETCRFVAVDIDCHTGQGRPLAMAADVYSKALDLGLAAVVIVSSPDGSCHVLIPFESPIPAFQAWRLGRWLVLDHAKYDLATRPEHFPKSPALSGKGCGTALRLPGRHHTEPYTSKVYDTRSNLYWLGAAAIEKILSTPFNDVSPEDLLPADFEPPRTKAAGGASAYSGAEHGGNVALAREALSFLGGFLYDFYDEWLTIGMALRQLGDDGLELWHEWSASSDYYRPWVLDQKWEGFEPGGGVTLGTLFYWAKEEGWPGPSRRPKSPRKTVTLDVRLPRLPDHS